MHKLTVVIMSIAACLVAPSCQPAHQPLPASFKPLNKTMLDSFSGPQRNKLQRLSSELRITHFENNQRIRGNAYGIIAKPDKFRIEVEGFFGAGGALSCDGNSLYLLDMQHKKHSHWPNAQASLQNSWLPLPLGCQDFVALLFGQLPDFEEETSTLRYKQGALLFEFNKDGNFWRARYHLGKAPPAQLQSISVYHDNAAKMLIWKAIIKDKQRIDDYIIPTQIEFQAPSHKLETIIQVRDHNTNPKIQTDIFKLPCPIGYQCQ